jgi:SAM-dependent methyltransferase
MPFISHRVYQWEPTLIDDSWGLKTISLGNAYALCNSLLCSQCGLLFLDIRFSDREMARLYQNYRDDTYTTLRDYYEPGYRSRNERLVQGLGINYRQDIEAFLQPHLPETVRVLDWGGDTGVNTPFKEGAGNEVHIYDISDVETTGKLRKVSKDTAAQHNYDLIVCSNVLEHIPYPRRVLAEIKSFMKPDAVLYIEVPLENLVKDYGGDKQLLNKKRHWHEHINFFNQDSLNALLTVAGFSLLDFHVQNIQSEGNPCSLFMLACVLSEKQPVL